MAVAGINTRDRIIKTAITLLWRQSYQGTSVDALCARADIKKGSFYHFFPSKTDLVVTSIETSWEHTRATVFSPIFDNDNNGLRQLGDFIHKVDEIQSDMLSHEGTYPGCPFGNMGQEMAHKDERIGRAIQKVFEAHCDYFEGALNRARSSGDIPPGDNRKRAKNFFALMEGGLLLAKVANDPAVFRDVAQATLLVAAGEF